MRNRIGKLETLRALAIALVAWAVPAAAFDGYIEVNGETTFVLGMYAFPENADALSRMAEAGINLIQCRNQVELDAAAAAGMQGWTALPFHLGATQSLREQVTALAAHPALAVWEGPDEVIWNFTAYSGLEKSVGIRRQDWWDQAPHAVAYAEQEAARILPNMGEAIALIREMDTRGRPVWMNEARETDVIYMREYLPWIDVLSCDDYPVKKSGESDLHRVARATDRYMKVSLGKPVWMVLQAFSWEDIQEGASDYPSFAESRYMAYTCIAQGARGLLYWGSQFVNDAAFMESLYALTSELAALNPLLVAPEVPGVEVTLVEAPDQPAKGVRVIARQHGDAWLIALVNDDDYRHHGTQVSGLDVLEGRALYELHGPRAYTVTQGMFVTRMQPYDVQVYCTSRDFESDWKTGRDYVDGTKD